MAEHRAKVQPIQVTYLCDEEDCGEQQVATMGFTNAIDSLWQHRCSNGHAGPEFPYDVKYPRIEYEVIPTYIEPEPDPILDLEPDEVLKINGRGTVAVYRDGSMPAGIYEPDQLNGSQVRIEGRLWKVWGVERYAVPLGTPEWPYTKGFGLLVKPVSDA